MGIQRLIALMFLATGLYLLGRDAATLWAATGAGPEALETLWRRIDSQSLTQFQSLIEQFLPGAVWDPGVLGLLRLPAWTLPLGIGSGLLFHDILSQRRGRAPQGS
jgi:hypothetical protein